jgi:hypothetical protein
VQGVIAVYCKYSKQWAPGGVRWVWAFQIITSVQHTYASTPSKITDAGLVPDEIPTKLHNSSVGIHSAMKNYPDFP